MTRTLRLLTGSIVFAFLIGHLLNLSLGLVSVELMDRVRPWLLWPWSNWVGAPLLGLSLVAHAALGLLALYRRNTLRMSRFDSWQLLSGLAIPPLLLPHFLVMLGGPLLGGAHASYAEVLAGFWIADPWAGLRQVLIVIVVWIHACMGLFVWMRIRAWWPRVAGLVYPLVVLVPVLALLGFSEAGKEVVAQRAGYGVERSGGNEAYAAPAGESGYGGDVYGSAGSAYGSGGYDAGGAYGASFGAADNGPVPIDGGAASRAALLETVVKVAYAVYACLLVVTLLARRLRLRERHGEVTIAYRGGPTIRTAAGPSILEISRMHDVGHGSLCGGKARCGTCRIRIVSGSEHLAPPSSLEREKLGEIGADGDVRLACQSRPRAGRLVVERILPAHVQPQDLRRGRSRPPRLAAGAAR